MALDPIRPDESVAITDAAVARNTSVRPQPEKPDQAAPLLKPVDPMPEPHDEVNVKWDRSDGVIVTITDKKSGDIVRQIPSEQVLHVARFIRQLLEQQESGNPASLIAGSEETQ
ncbi:MAG TPA: flagellar protein FlaG [Terriglobales bacterium]|nr:flagellar protein FlaG [Terriglobales bacterium]